MATILVVDDELGIRALLSEILTDEGHTVEVAEDAAQARAIRERQSLDLVLLDIWMPDVDGITLLKEWGSTGQLTMPVIMMSGHGTIDTAVEAMKFGAIAFLEKPVTLQKLLRAVEEGLSRGEGKAVAGAAAGAARPGAAGASAAVGGTPMGVGHTPPSGAADAGRTAGAWSPTAPGLGSLDGSAQLLPAGAAAGALAAGGDRTPTAEQVFSLERPLREARDAFEKAYFEYHLAQEHGSMTRVAEKTGLERTHLYRKLKQLGVDLGKTKRGAH